jgi:hypothetical protein
MTLAAADSSEISADQRERRYLCIYLSVLSDVNIADERDCRKWKG